jgi:hypothetical protein
MTMLLKRVPFFTMTLLMSASLVMTGCGKFTSKSRHASDTTAIDFDDDDENEFDGDGNEEPIDGLPTEEPADNPPVDPTTGNVLPFPSIPSGNPTTSTTIRARWNAKGAEGALWTRYTMDSLASLGKNLIGQVPKDMANYCPTYAKLTPAQRATVWVMLISAVAEKESSFKPKSYYTEGFKDSTGKLVVSRGLMQISSKSSNAYACGIQKETDLENAKTNLACGVRILNRQIGSSHFVSAHVKNKRGRLVWVGGASYWSVLRNSPKHKWIQAQVRALPVCKP